MPEIVRRSSTRRAPGRFFGMNGSITAHCVSENQNKSAIALSRYPPRSNESDSRTPRNNLIGFRP